MEYRSADLDTLTLPAGAFDIVYSSLALHYIEDFARLAATIRQTLTSHGRLVFSVEHPLFTAPTRPGWIEVDGRTVWPLDAYLAEGRRVTEWFAPGVVKYHRTTASYLNSLILAGFAIDRVVEWAPSPAHIATHPEWANEMHRPPFLLLAATAR